MVRVLFVCMGNICRSPAAEGIFSATVEKSGLAGKIDCDSAGTLDAHAGERADRRMRSAAENRGYALESRARGFRRGDFSNFDWIITMDNENFRNIVRLAPDESAKAKVRRFCDWVDLPGVSEVPDPYYGGDRGFEKVLDILENGTGSLLKWIQSDDEQPG